MITNAGPSMKINRGGIVSTCIKKPEKPSAVKRAVHISKNTIVVNRDGVAFANNIIVRKTVTMKRIETLIGRCSILLSYCKAINYFTRITLSLATASSPS